MGEWVRQGELGYVRGRCHPVAHLAPLSFLHESLFVFAPRSDEAARSVFSGVSQLR